MEITLVFQLLGVAYTAIGLAILLNPSYYKKMLDEYIRSTPIVFLNAFLVLVLGYILLVVNHTWGSGAPVLITILGWLGLIKGLYIILLPKQYAKLIRGMKLKYLPMEAAFTVILGIVLLYLGFFN